MLWIADPTPATWPVQTCNEPAGCTTFFFTTDIIALPMILRHTSSIPTGLTPFHLSSGIIWLVTPASFHDNSVSGTIAFLSFWLMIFKALNYDSKNIWTRNDSPIASTKVWWTSCFFVLMTFFETSLWWFYQLLSHVFHLLDHVKEACQTCGLFYVNLLRNLISKV